jgi:hypothetical protein
MRGFPHEGLKKISTVRARPAIAMLFLLAAHVAAEAQAPAPPGDPMAARLSADKVAEVETGVYSAGDNIGFSLDLAGGKYLLRFDGNPETFALQADRVALGGRVLKYDTGATALRVSVWGGLTLYPDYAPGGLPATRTGDLSAPAAPTVSAADLETALRDEASHLAYVQHVTVRFSAPIAGDVARTQAFDALTNIDGGIGRLVASPPGRAAFAKRIQTIKLAEGDHPAVSLSGRVLTVVFVPDLGAAGRPSSRAIAVALGKFLSVPETD